MSTQTQTQTAPILAGDEGAVADAKQPKEADQALVDLMAACPNSWAGDEGFKKWCEEVYGAGAASVAPPAPPAPAISALDPATLPAGSTAVKLTVAGAGLDDGAIVTAAGEDQTTTIGASAYLSDTLVANAGTVPIQVRNADGQLSNTIDLTVT